MDGLWSGLANELVEEAGVGKGTTAHDEVVAAASAVGVEVDWLHTLLLQVTAGRRAGRDVASWADVIGGNRVAKGEVADRIGD